MNTSELDDLAPVIGYRASRIIAAWFAGRKLHVPTQARVGHPLETLMGRSAFVALVNEFGASSVCVPTTDEDDRYRRNRLIAERFAAGATGADVAAELGLTIRRVEQIRVDLVALGWLLYAQGFDTAKAQARRAAGSGAPEVLFSGTAAGFLETGEVFGEPPPPADGLPSRQEGRRELIEVEVGAG